MLKAVSAGEHEGMTEGLKIEAEGSAHVRKTADCIEGFAAFMEKKRADL